VGVGDGLFRASQWNIELREKTLLLSCWHVLMLRERPSYPRLLEQMIPGSIIFTGDRRAINGTAPSTSTPTNKFKKSPSEAKVKNTVFWACEGVIPVDIMPEERQANPTSMC
jgi:hypothetical protein